MKIMLLNTLFYPNIFGGAEKSVQILAEGLAELGHEVVVVSIADHEEVFRFDNMTVYFLHHHNVFWGGMTTKQNRLKKMLWHLMDIFNPFMYRSLDRLVKSEKPDIIHTNMLTGFSSIPWVVAQKNCIPVVHTLREYSLICGKSTMFKYGHNCQQQCLSCRLITFPKRYLSNHGYVDHVVGLSHFIIDRHQRENYFSLVPHSRIFNGISKIEADPKVAGPMGSRSIRMLYLGRIEKTKGVDAVLDAVQQVKGVELHLGGRVLDDAIQAKIDKGTYPDNIKFLGFIDPEKVIGEFDVLIVPSIWYEPFGRVVIEAYQHGKPVIAASRGGMPEIVVEGETGFLYDPETEAGLVTVLQQLIDNPEILSAMQDSIGEYSVKFKNEHIVREYEKIYASLA